MSASVGELSDSVGIGGSPQGDGERVWQGNGHGLDARYRLPWFGGPVYIRVVLGRERRPKSRHKEEAALNVRRSVLNVMLFIVGACLLYSAVGVALLLMSSVLT